MVLVAYGLIQGGLWRELNPGYLVFNVCGSLLLRAVPLIERQAGFALLEFPWAGLAIGGVARVWRAKRMEAARA